MKLNGAAVVIIKLIPSTKTFNRGRGESERRKPFARSNGKSQRLFILISFTPAARERKKIGRSGENHGMRHSEMWRFGIVAEMRLERYSFIQ